MHNKIFLVTEGRKRKLLGVIRCFHNTTVKVLNCNESCSSFSCKRPSYLLWVGSLPLKDRCAYSLCIVYNLHINWEVEVSEKGKNTDKEGGCGNTRLLCGE